MACRHGKLTAHEHTHFDFTYVVGGLEALVSLKGDWLSSCPPESLPEIQVVVKTSSLSPPGDLTVCVLAEWTSFFPRTTLRLIHVR